MVEKGLHRIALVGTPCQIKAVRKIETLGVVPSDSIKFCLGLFCSGNFLFGEAEKQRLEEIGQFKFQELKKINVKDTFVAHLKNGKRLSVPLEQLDFMKRYACRYCMDYSAEYADISFGGIGAKEGWTTVITRSPLGRAIFADAKGKTLEIPTPSNGFEENAKKTLEKIRQASDRKLKSAEINRKKL
jgi:coenzyme F420 hydrogenase subunit beta